MTTVSPEVNAPDDRNDRALFMHLDPVVRLNDDQFYELCRLNRNLRIERAAGGGMSIMPPAGGETSRRNAEIARQLGNWTRRTRTGACFDSSCGFVLPNGAVRSPDASWVAHEHLDALTDEQRSRFLPLCPDFVAELRSPTDELAALHDKMREYVDNGAKLGWLIDSRGREVFIYRPGVAVECLREPPGVSAEPLLAGFRLTCDEMW